MKKFYVLRTKEETYLGSSYDTHDNALTEAKKALSNGQTVCVYVLEALEKVEPSQTITVTPLE